ncbi:MAG: ChaN family lipoprotein, partial [Deltaproteobacteria bacterium]|nr:ChaN family lipoprotein [Deltaproteobacteria bacterium]
MRRRSRTEALVGLVVIASAASCGGAETRARDARSTAATSPPSTRGTAPERSSPFARALAPDRWLAPLERDHPLVGRVWSPARGAFVDADEVAREVGRARYVLLGEKHDDPDHQRLAVAWIETIAAADRRPSVVFEMLDADRQSAIEAAFARDPSTRSDPDVLARAIGWTESGWPFARYRPVVAAALAASFDVRAGNYPRDRTRRLVREGEAALEAGERARLGLDRVLPDAQRAALEREMADSHCGMLPATMLGPMALAQRARDGEMAAAMVASGERGSLLVAGSG